MGCGNPTFSTSVFGRVAPRQRNAVFSPSCPPCPTWTGSFLLATFSIKRNGRVNEGGRDIEWTEFGSRHKNADKFAVGKRERNITVRSTARLIEFVSIFFYPLRGLPSPSFPLPPSADHLPRGAQWNGESTVNGKFSRLPPIPTDFYRLQSREERSSAAMISRVAEDFYRGKCVRMYIRKCIAFKLKT